MRPGKTSKPSKKRDVGRMTIVSALMVLACIVIPGCGNLERPGNSPYFADVVPPAKQELRWSNGKLPKSFDPAMAAVPPETDIVRAIYEGLTVTDPKTLEAAPAVAEKWSSSDGYRIWKFELRRDTKWTNGKSVTAYDFVHAWTRLADLGEAAAHPELLHNFARLKSVKPGPEKLERKSDETPSTSVSQSPQGKTGASTPSIPANVPACGI